MAGLGRKVFTAGEVLTAVNVQGYLQDQVVMVFDDAATRTSTLGTAVAEGMVSYLKDTNGVQAYDGSAWVSVVSDPTLTSSTATSYTVASSDANNYLQFTNAGTVTVGTGTAFTAGQQVQILADGTALTIAGDGGVTLAGAGTAGTAVSFTVGGQYEAVAIVGVGSDAYRIIGNITAV